MATERSKKEGAFSSGQRKSLFLDMARSPTGASPSEVYRAAIEQGDSVTEEAYYNIARRLVHRGLIVPLADSGQALRYGLGAPAQDHWLEEDDLSSLVDPDYPLLAITIWQESQRQINEVPESVWVELRERLRNRPAQDLFFEAIVSYADDFLAQIATLADKNNFSNPKSLSDAKQEAENGRQLLLRLAKYGLGLSREAISVPVSVDAAISELQKKSDHSLIDEKILKSELERRIAPEAFIVNAPATPQKSPLLLGGVDGSTRGGVLSFLGEEGDFSVGHAPMIAINTAVGQVNRDITSGGRTVPAFLRLPEKPEDMQRQDNRYTVMAKMLYPDMSDAQYMHSVWNAMDLIETKAALRLLKRWYPQPAVEITGADVVIRDGTVSPQDRDSSHYREISSYGQIVRDMIETNWEIVKRCKDEGQTLGGVVKNAQLNVFGPVINWFACRVAQENAIPGTTQLQSWPLQTMNLVPDQIVLTRLLTAGRDKNAEWIRTCVVLRPFHALTNYARTHSRLGGAAKPLLDDYVRALEAIDELDQEQQHFWGTLFRGENDPYVKMLSSVFYGSFFLGALPRLDNEKNLPRIEFLIPSPTGENEPAPWSEAIRHRDRMISALQQNGFDVAAEHRMFGNKAKLDVQPGILIRVHDTVKHWAAELLSRVQEYVGFHLARYVKGKKLRGVQVRPFNRAEMEMLHSQLRQEREFQAGASRKPPSIDSD